jgi:hypothetical protein
MGWISMRERYLKRIAARTPRCSRNRKRSQPSTRELDPHEPLLESAFFLAEADGSLLNQLVPYNKFGMNEAAPFGSTIEPYRAAFSGRI